MVQCPPQGKSALYYHGAVCVLTWEPGNGSRYVLQTTPLESPLDAVMGGTVMVALSSMADGSFVAYPVTPEAVGHWTRDYVRKTWRRINGIVDHAAHLAMLLNWALGGERAHAYAEELWREAHGDTGTNKVVQLHARRVHRRQGANT